MKKTIILSIFIYLFLSSYENRKIASGLMTEFIRKSVPVKDVVAFIHAIKFFWLLSIPDNAIPASNYAYSIGMNTLEERLYT